MSLKPIRPAPLPPSTGQPPINVRSKTRNKKNDNNNEQKISSFDNVPVKPTIIRPKMDSQQVRKKKLPPPRPAPPKINKFGNGGNNENKQDLFHSNALQDDFTFFFGDANEIKQNSKQPLQTFQNKNSKPPRINQRSVKKRAPNPLENHVQSSNALIDFDSPVSSHSVSSNKEEICKIFEGNFNTCQTLKSEQKSLLDMDDPPMENFKSYSLLDIEKSNSLPIGNNFENFPMNGIEKCEKYVSSVNTLSINGKLEEIYQKKPVPAPRRTFENIGKENRLVNKAEFQQTAIFPPNITNKFKSSHSDNHINDHQVCQANKYSFSSTNSVSNFQEKELHSRTDQTINNNWNDVHTTITNFHSTSNEVVWDHCASPFSDISSYNTMGSIDSNDESVDIYECPPEPEFPPPPPPTDILLEEEQNENYIQASINSKTFQTDNVPLSKTQMLKALYDFEGQSVEEISFKEGDILYLENKITGDWWKGSINDQTGIFPASFVEIINNKRISYSEEKTKVCLVTALYQFDGEEDGDLSFKAGEEIRVLSRINKDWLFGECNNHRGQFPVSFVKQKQSSENVCGLYIAKFQFVSENYDELAFQEGDKITVTECINNDWWKGFLTDDNGKREGIFPCAFVQKFYA